jgi:hypothetical protein
MEPKEVVRAWVDAFNRADAATLAEMYLRQHGLPVPKR